MGRVNRRDAHPTGADEAGDRAGRSRTDAAGPGGGPDRAVPARPPGAPVARGRGAAVVLDLLRGAGADGISRLELAERAGLTPQAVSKITARLRAEGLAREAGRRASTGGKPRTVLRLVPDAAHAVGVHLDRDELRAVLVDLAGATVAAHRTPLDFAAGPEAAVEAAAAATEHLLRERARPDSPAPAVAAVTAPAVHRPAAGPRGPLGVGVALPGPLDHRTGVLHRVTGHPEWDGFPLRDTLARRLGGTPVVVDKDTNAAALGPALRRAAGESFAYLHLGTGLGAGLVLGGAVYRGSRTGAGEFGHQVVQLDGPVCGCGQRGCVEALCLAAVERGDVAGAARVLGIGAANLVSLLDIDLVLLGGRTVAADETAFVDGVAAVLGERARREGGPAVPVRAAGGGVRGVAEGAAQAVLAPLFGRTDRADGAG
ncbi:ROK family protein [Streptomyces sp. NPDC060194]|uniref:ROK family transcriptional regulator n=1 Tax=Streptomyces sp. NPDC060194 TaxID=3347069 RepID=UPI00365ABAD5